MKTITLLSILSIMLSAAGVRASECMWYNDSENHYSICVPRDWKQSAGQDRDSRVLVLKKKGAPGAEISCAASRASEDDAAGEQAWKKKHGSGYRKIIETRELAAGDNVRVRFIVFDYTSRGVRMIQRTMLSRYGDRLLAVECRAPVRYFSRYTDVFNMVMSSVDYTGSKAGELQVQPAEEKGAAPVKKKQVPGKKAEPAKKAKPENRGAGKKRVEPERESSIVRPREERNVPLIEKPAEEKTKPEPDIKKEASPQGKTGENVDIDLDSVEDPEARKIMESELKTLRDMEQRGLIEKVPEDQ